jgi:signal transduction histidine kinase
VGISKDVTEENRLRRQLIESERLAAIGQTVAGLTHCIKNILNGLKGGSYLIDVGLKRNQHELIEEGWQTVQKGIARIQNLSLDMLGYCRPRLPEYQSADPLQLVLETTALVSQAARQEGIDLQVAGPEGLLVDLDPVQIGRVLLNLITNALDACREKAYAEGETPSVQVAVEMEGDRLKISVRDNGIGMDEDVKAQLFKRFFSTKDSGGTGLGLPVTEKIISEHGGTIGVDSSPGRGTTFTVYLPASTCQEGSGITSKQ